MLENLIQVAGVESKGKITFGLEPLASSQIFGLLSRIVT